MTTAMSAAIAAVWERSREELERRIATLERAVAALLADDLGDALRTSAHSDAHKLAGSLGMFGLAAGSQLAHEVEQKLAGTDALPLSEGPRLAQLVGSLREQFDVHSDGRRAIDGGQHPGHALDPRAAAHARGNRRPSGGATRTILVIDDSALIRDVVGHGLGDDRGWKVRAARSGAEGVELAVGERPDAILLDVEMPALDGPATLACLRARVATREIPVLFLTGHAGDDERRRFAALGAAGVIAKPFDPASLRTQIAELLGWAP